MVTPTPWNPDQSHIGSSHPGVKTDKLGKVIQDGDLKKAKPDEETDAPVQDGTDGAPAEGGAVADAPVADEKPEASADEPGAVEAEGAGSKAKTARYKPEE